jgi:hypothetical protein
MEKTEDQVWRPEDFSVQEGSNSKHVKDWFYHQCATDRSEGRPASYACERAIIKESYFNQLTLDIKYKNVPKEILNMTQKLDLALKVGLYENMDNNALDIENNKDQIRIIAQYSGKIPDVPMMNVQILKPQEETKFEKVHIPLIRPPSTLLPYSEVLMNLVTGYENTPACALMEQAIRTFDNVTIDLPETPCQILVAMDCSPHERFAVYSKELDPETHDKKVTVITAGKEIKLMPPQQQDLMQIQVDGKTHELTADKPISFCSTNECVRVYLRKTESDAVSPIAVVENLDDDVTVLFDGKNAKVLLGNGYAGQTCGVCGDNDDETEEEFVGPAMCIYEKSEDFINSYSMAGEHCAQVPHPIGKVRCPKGDKREIDELDKPRKQVKINTRRNPTGKTTVVTEKTVIPPPSVKQVKQVMKNACQQLRTEYMVRNQMVCFTTRPVLACGQTCRASSSQQVSLDFHCLPKASPFTQQLIVDAQKMVLKQLVNKRVDLRQSVDIPLGCVVAA